jgi:hypothetical protein
MHSSQVHEQPSNQLHSPQNQRPGDNPQPTTHFSPQATCHLKRHVPTWDLLGIPRRNSAIRPQPPVASGLGPEAKLPTLPIAKAIGHKAHAWDVDMKSMGCFGSFLFFFNIGFI